ncbi:Crp/Fnr family transcriptional regulator [Aquabacterium sp. A3]|uniref:Crp/Fnr family transcriptional regulator n=1 Tax=Aquabacterium sp. A3 TaxID=3132829 RepID=UPI00311926BE
MSDAAKHLARNVADTLGQTYLFAGTSAELRQRVVAGSQVRRVARAALLFEAGQPSEGLFIVLSGQVKLFARADNGQEKVIEVVSQLGHLGESIVFDHATHVTNARALSETVVLLVPAEVLLHELSQDPALATHMLMGLARRLNAMIRDIEALTLRSSVRRVVDYLLRAQPGQGPSATVSLPFSKSTLASLLSVTPEHFSRILHELQSKGLIAVNRRDIHIPDTSLLAQVA